jgi:hypothetical protein
MHGWSWLMPRPCQHLSDKGETELREVRTSAKQLVKMFPSPYLTTITQQPVSKIARFYDPNIPFHLLNARLY